jgi:hypothetical protein
MAVMLGLTLVAAATVAAPAASEPQAAAGSFDLHATFDLMSRSVPCPADVPPATTECRALTGWSGNIIGRLVQGLGWVSEATYTLPLGLGPPTCPTGLGKPLATTGRLIVEGKGEIAVAVSEGARCVAHEFALDEPQEFTITGGTGPFAGASGKGTLAREWSTWDPDFPVEEGSLLEPGAVLGVETWTGTLTAPGLHLRLPRLTGAVAKSVRASKGAKSARVTFNVTATDDDGGDIPVSCWPRSGSRFPLGKTTVSCAATDASGNTATARFTVTVRPRR